MQILGWKSMQTAYKQNCTTDGLLLWREEKKNKKDKSEILSTVLSGLSVMENCN